MKRYIFFPEKQTTRSRNLPYEEVFPYPEKQTTEMAKKYFYACDEFLEFIDKLSQTDGGEEHKMSVEEVKSKWKRSKAQQTRKLTSSGVVKTQPLNESRVHLKSRSER